MSGGNFGTFANKGRTWVLAVAFASSGMVALAQVAAAQTGQRPYSEQAASPHGNAVAGTSAQEADVAKSRASMDGLQRRLDIVNQMADKFSADAAATFGAGFNAHDWKRDFGLRWMQQPAEVLALAASAPDLAIAQEVLSRASNRVAAKALNDLRVQFLPAPCRIVDTRNAGGQLGPAYRFEYASAGASRISAQGGNPSGCTTTAMEGALLYVTVVPPAANTAPNFLAAQNSSTPAIPTSAAINFVNQNIANFVIVPTIFLITPPPPGVVTGYGFYLYSSGLTHVVVDLIGYLGHSELAYAPDCYTTATNNVSTQGGGNTTVPGYNDFAVPQCAGGYVPIATYCNFQMGTTTTVVSVLTDKCTILTDQSFNTLNASTGASGRCCRLGPGI